MRSAVTCFLIFLLGATLGCGSAGMSSNSLRQNVTPSNVSVTLQPVQPASPAQIVASAASPFPIQQWQVAVDSAVVWQQASSQPQIAESIPMSTGQHEITATATNSDGSSGSASVAVTIPASSGDTASTLSVALKPIGASSPTTITAVAQGPHPLTGWALYVDGNLVNRNNSSADTFSQTVQMADGKHQVLARVWDTTGAYAAASATADITNSTYSATSGGLIPTPPSSARTWNDVEEMHGWSDCGACAGNASGSGPVGTYWYKQDVSSPSLDGNSMETYIGGWVPWADNVFGYHFGPQSWANHIIYTVHFMWNASHTRSADGNYVVQAVEFDSFFFTNGFKYMFGTQCDYAGGYWGVWNGPDNRWQNTSLRCTKFPPNQWHTITWYVERDQSQKKLHFVALSVDGNQSRIDSWMNAVGSSTPDDSGIQFQQDSDQYGSPWNAWIDKVSVTIW